eukprot:m.907499 g.907499  ORF g.907499 m.907499 type:complete len:262 (+) comp60092_c0_seq4:2139-2924(+)
MLEQTLTTSQQRLDTPKRARKEAASGVTSDVQLLEFVLQELPPLIDPSDLHAAQLALNIVTSIVSCHKSIAASLKERYPVVAGVMQVCESGQLQISSLLAVTRFLATLVSLHLPDFQYRDIVNLLKEPVFGLWSPGKASLPKHALFNIGKCIAAISSPADALATVQAFLQECTASDTGRESVQMLSLITIGEIGKRQDLATHDAVLQTVTQLLQSASEDVAIWPPPTASACSLLAICLTSCRSSCNNCRLATRVSIFCCLL